MVTEMRIEEIAHIGAVAGIIWHHLEASGPVSMNRLIKEIDAPRDVVMQGVGWLAREGKVQFIETPRSKLIALS